MLFWCSPGHVLTHPHMNLWLDLRLTMRREWLSNWLEGGPENSLRNWHVDTSSTHWPSDLPKPRISSMASFWASKPSAAMIHSNMIMFKIIGKWYRLSWVNSRWGWKMSYTDPILQGTVSKVHHESSMSLYRLMYLAKAGLGATSLQPTFSGGFAWWATSHHLHITAVSDDLLAEACVPEHTRMWWAV